MDFQNRPGGKTGSGAPASAQELALDRRERLRRLAMETVDMSKDPYMLRNHLGSYECKLCLTLHKNEGNYMAHTQGKKHQVNLARRAQKEKQTMGVPTLVHAGIKPQVKRTIAKIGRPGYKVTKVRCPDSGEKGMLFEIDYAEIAEDFMPKHRVMSSYEQRLEEPDERFQFLLFAADPYETIAFKVPNLDIEKKDPRYYQCWDSKKKQYTLQVFFKPREAKPLPALSQRPGTFDPIASRF